MSIPTTDEKSTQYLWKNEKELTICDDN